ncbi:MAG: DUF4278 domain-containing protein [Oculatellaceae cyanobacterium Prado106]|jgi:hypothetical protein|nr:DUF4278 domain-containing protein [Oculatellaceae cyanobacterium Prado106]
MKLHYRGATYEHIDPSVEMSNVEVVEHYRGATVTVRQPKPVPAQRSNTHLKYRGAWVN